MELQDMIQRASTMKYDILDYHFFASSKAMQLFYFWSIFKIVCTLSFTVPDGMGSQVSESLGCTPRSILSQNIIF